MAFLFSFFVMLIVSLLVVIVQVLVAFLAMYAMNRFWEDTDFGDFSFNPLDKQQLPRLLLHTALIVGIPTLALHFIYFLVTYFLPSARNGLSFPLFILFLQAILPTAAYFKLFRLDPKKAAALSAVNLLYYIIAFFCLGVGGFIAG